MILQKGPLPPGWQDRLRSARKRAVVADVLDRYRQHYQEGTLPRSGRGIFYDLRPRGFGRGITYTKRPKDRAGWYDPAAPNAQQGRYGPMEGGPDYVREVVADARRALLLPEHWVADARAPAPRLPYLGPQTAAEMAGRVMDRVIDAEVTLDRQGGQDIYVEVWCEAGDLIERLARVASEHHVPVYSGGGMDGLKAKRVAARRIADRVRDDGQHTAVLLVGDYDDHGRTIRDVYEADVTAWLTEHEHGSADMVEFATIAVTRDQAVEHDLLDDEGKAEADGIPVPVLDRIVREAIEAQQHPARREQVGRDEAEANETVRLLIEQGLDALARGREDT